MFREDEDKKDQKTVLTDILNTCRDSIIISDMFTKANQVINEMGHTNIVCSISGGADSDIILDAIYKVDFDKKVTYVWFDTGLEYQATKDHLKYLENRYDIQIVRERAIKPIPQTVKEYGQPFLSKFASENIARLQKFNFKWEDRPYEELAEEYPNCNSAIQWWCNYRDTTDFGFSYLNIEYNQYLKEFLIANPPTFKISPKCCDWAKKKVSRHFVSKHKIDCMITGIRKSEGGIRSSRYKECYAIDKFGIANYRPIFWFTGTEKWLYNMRYKIENSDCYTKWGFTRTGCCCCPYAPKFGDELIAVEQYEPKLYKAVKNIFKDSYEYTIQYKNFVREMKDLKLGRRKLF